MYKWLMSIKKRYADPHHAVSFITRNRLCIFPSPIEIAKSPFAWKYYFTQQNRSLTRAWTMQNLFIISTPQPLSPQYKSKIGFKKHHSPTPLLRPAGMPREFSPPPRITPFVVPHFTSPPNYFCLNQHHTQHSLTHTRRSQKTTA